MIEAEKPHEIGKKARKRSNGGCITCKCVIVTLSLARRSSASDKIVGFDGSSAMKADRRATGARVRADIAMAILHQRNRCPLPL